VTYSTSVFLSTRSENGVGEPVSQVRDNGSQDIVEEYDEGVVAQISDEGDGVVPGWILAEGRVVKGNTVGVLNVKEVNQGSG
jgi:hypothetical protein